METKGRGTVRAGMWGNRGYGGILVSLYVLGGLETPKVVIFGTNFERLKPLYSGTEGVIYFLQKHS